jgi:hypothetical protein
MPSLNAQGAAWDYVDVDGTHRALPMRAQVTVNGTEALIAAGAIVEVLPDFVAPAMPVSLKLPHRRQLAPRVQAVMAWLTQVISPILSTTA